MVVEKFSGIKNGTGISAPLKSRTLPVGDGAVLALVTPNSPTPHHKITPTFLNKGQVTKAERETDAGVETAGHS